jgi:hypothetical protein
MGDTFFAQESLILLDWALGVIGLDFARTQLGDPFTCPFINIWNCLGA